MVDFKRLILNDLELRFRQRLQNENLIPCMVFDLVLVHFVIFPCFTLAWYGTWNNANVLFDDLIFRGDLVSSSCVSLALGVTGEAAGSWFVDKIKDAAFAGNSRIKYFLISRIYTIYSFYFELFIWKGVWGIGENIVGTSWTISLCEFLIPLSVLLVLRSVQMPLNLPTCITLDLPHIYFDCDTALGTKHDADFFSRFEDHVVSGVLHVFAVISFYGAWKINEVFFDDLDKEDGLRTINSIKSLAFAYALNLTGMFIQCCTLYLDAKKPPPSPSVVEFVDGGSDDETALSGGGGGATATHGKRFFIAVFYELAAVAGLFTYATAFRGGWYLLEVNFMTDNAQISYFIGMAAGPALLCMFYCMSSFNLGLTREKFRADNGVLFLPVYTTYFLAQKSDPDEWEQRQQLVD